MFSGLVVLIGGFFGWVVFVGSALFILAILTFIFVGLGQLICIILGLDDIERIRASHEKADKDALAYDEYDIDNNLITKGHDS